MPVVSVIVPCYNEEATIQLLLDALYKQTYAREDMEVVISDGFSTDGTRQKIASFQENHPDLKIKVVDNQKRTIPAALNRALAAAGGQYIVRLDAHSVPNPEYVARSIASLESGTGDNVGGVWEIRPAGPGVVARGIAAAAAHPLGVGDAHYRYTGRARQVDTVPFGAFRRSLIETVGGFDETLLSNEDYEFNVRVRKNGGCIWLDPSIRSTYFARSTLPALARQYWRYGFWKARMLKRYPETLRWRQALPPLFVLNLVVLVLLAFWLPLARLLLAVEIVFYMMILLAASIHLALAKKEAALMLPVPAAIMIMHLAWGLAFLWSLLTSGWRKSTLSQVDGLPTSNS